MANTRSSKAIFLIAKTKSDIKDDQLPTNEDILQYYYHVKTENPDMDEKSIVCCGFTHDLNLNCDSDCSCVMKKIVSIHNKAGVPTIRSDKIKKTVSDLIYIHKKLISLQKRESETEQEKRDNFTNNLLPKLFDIMPKDVEETIEKDKKRTQEDKNHDITFIRDQRGPRKRFIGKEDTRYVKAVQRSEKRNERLSNIEVQPSTSQNLTVSSSSEDEISSEEADSSSPSHIEPKDHEPQPSTSKGAVVEETVLLSKVKHVSVRAQSEILSQVAGTTGISGKGMSKSNVHRIGKKVVKETAAAVRESVKSKQGSIMILHFDGKIVKEYTKGKKLTRDRLAVSVNCEGEDTLLGIPPCINSTGECQTEKIIEVLESYGLKNEIKGLVFDTTASNTGKEKGVCNRLNEYLEGPVLHLACRHHIYECHIKNVSKIFRPTSGPDHPLFKTLLSEFPNIEFDQSKLCKFQYGQNDELDKAAKEALDVVSRLLTEDQLPRGDYIELAELVKFYLSPDDVELKIRQPGPVHHARFMAQAIYYLKLKILSQLTNILSTAATKKEVDAMSEFIALYYAKWFLTSSLTACSPRLDLEAIWDMKRYKTFRPDIAQKCLTSMANHPWYLHPTLIPFSLLDAGVPDDEKRDIADKIFDIDPNTDVGTKYENIQISDIIEIEGDRPSLSNFVKSSSRLIFNILNFDKEKMEWLLLPTNLWNLMTPFKYFNAFVTSLPVVNDAAERNVKLVQDFIAGSQDEELRQDLFLAMEQKRKGGRPKGSKTGAKRKKTT